MVQAYLQLSKFSGVGLGYPGQVFSTVDRWRPLPADSHVGAADSRVLQYLSHILSLTRLQTIGVSAHSPWRFHKRLQMHQETQPALSESVGLRANIAGKRR